MMKRILTTTLVMLIACTTMMAQHADFQKAVVRYKNCTTVTASVTKTTVKKALANAEVAQGTLTMKRPSEVSISVNEDRDQLLMQGSKFTMVVRGKKHTTTSENNPQFASFQTVFESILSGGAKDISKLGDLTVTRQGQLLILTITPEPDSKKAARRMLFSSFVLAIDTKSSELRSLRLNEKAGNYTEYKFTNFSFK